ncbi:hypothetical protein QBC40DRAFT_294549 [Triangularia verruculosa]|uniref:Uncharacterized protein n=1 Tax=Triangularia verruculosa TaxID=2587418 RepID=A0AAN7AVI0_9PEZI|nr:hypothetical protein QBC40DRAFT_294549 [Triangularia verruculosa]
MITLAHLPPALDRAIHPKCLILPMSCKFIALDTDSLTTDEAAIVFMQWAHYWGALAQSTTLLLMAAERDNSAGQKAQDDKPEENVEDDQSEKKKKKKKKNKKSKKKKSKASPTAAEGSSASVNLDEATAISGSATSVNPDDDDDDGDNMSEDTIKMMDEKGFNQIADFLRELKLAKSSSAVPAQTPGEQVESSAAVSTTEAKYRLKEGSIPDASFKSRE